jgi:hypothetical protein
MNFRFLSAPKRKSAEIPFIEMDQECDAIGAPYVQRLGKIHLTVTIWSGLADRSKGEKNARSHPMSIFTDITFFEVCMALVTVGMAERALLAYAPIKMVGPNGWLIRADIEE